MGAVVVSSGSGCHSLSQLLGLGSTVTPARKAEEGQQDFGAHIEFVRCQSKFMGVLSTQLFRHGGF